MLIIIRNLPSLTRYTDVKNLIQTHCDLSNVILDNLIADGVNKRVTVGVADEVDAEVIRRNLNGFNLAGNKLKIEEMRPKKPPQQNSQDHSSSSRGSSRWGSSIPPLMDTNTMPGINPLMNQNTSMGKNMPMMGQNFPMMGDNAPMMGFNPPMMGMNAPMLNQNTMMMGQSSPMMGQNSPMMGQNPPMLDLSNSTMGQNMSMGRHNQSRNDRNGSSRGQSSSMGNQNSQKMGQMDQFNPFMGPMSALNQPAMVPPPLMGNPPFSAPFYMTPQSNIYGNHTSGQQLASQLPDYSGQKGNRQSQISDYPDTRSRKSYSDKPAWDSSADDSNYRNKRYSGNSERDRDRERDSGRHDRGPSSSARRSKWDAPREHESEGSRYKSQYSTKRVVKPWAADIPPYSTNPEYGQFDRSHDREQDRYSRRQDQVPDYSGPSYQNRMSSGGGRDFQSRESHRRGQSPPRRAPPRDDWRERDRGNPPSKRFKPNEPQNRNQGPLQKNNVPPKMAMRKILERDVSWRNQAAATLAAEMLKNIKTAGISQQDIALRMKSAVRNRLLIILNNRINVKVPDQMALYRRKFRPDEDQHLYNRIVRHIKRETKRVIRLQSADQDGVQADKANADVKQPAKATAKPAPAKPQQNQPGVLPKYPKGSKALHHIQKKTLKEEFQTASPCSELDEVTKKVVEEEMENIREIILAECTANPEDEAQKFFCDKMHNKTKILDENKKIISLNLARRLLKSGSVPVIRVIGVPKPPRKASLVEFLKDRGVTSLKKSDRKALYIVTCNSYDSFDALCALKDVVIDDIKVSFKPMHLTPPPQKFKHKKGQGPQQRMYSAGQANSDQEDEINDEEDVIIEGHEAEVKQEIKTEVVSPVKNKETKNDIELVDVKTETKDEVIQDVKHDESQCVENEGGDYKDDDDFTKDVSEAPEGKANVAQKNDVEQADNDDGDFEVNEDDLEDY